MESVFLVSGGRTEALKGLIKSQGLLNIREAVSGAEARRALIDADFDLVIINSPLSDEFGHELAADASAKGAGTLLLAKSEIADEVSARVEDYGVFVLEKPITRQSFYRAVKLIAAAQKRVKGLKKENIRLLDKIEEIKTVDRAKCALIEYLNMTEAHAHRYIEKKAMDTRRTKAEVAREILKDYEV